MTYNSSIILQLVVSIKSYNLLILDKSESMDSILWIFHISSLTESNLEKSILGNSYFQYYF